MMLPLITSPETIATMEWLKAEQQRYNYWREQAQQLVLQHGMEGAIPHLSALLCERVAREIGRLPGLGKTLLEAALKRINYFELAVGFLREYDSADYFAPHSQAALAAEQLVS